MSVPEKQNSLFPGYTLQRISITQDCSDSVVTTTSKDGPSRELEHLEQISIVKKWWGENHRFPQVWRKSSAKAGWPLVANLQPQSPGTENRLEVTLSDQDAGWIIPWLQWIRTVWQVPWGLASIKWKQHGARQCWRLLHCSTVIINLLEQSPLHLPKTCTYLCPMGPNSPAQTQQDPWSGGSGLQPERYTSSMAWVHLLLSWESSDSGGCCINLACKKMSLEPLFSICSICARFSLWLNPALLLCSLCILHTA